jgi:hypothetical protein
VLGLDERIAELGSGAGLAVVLALAVLLGLRHATDPDHLTAVSTLVMSERDGVRRAGRLGLAWGAGHATTLLAVGIPTVLARRALPPFVQRAAEVAVGAIIVALACRLLLRWRRGYLHVHPHRHGAKWHAHPHAHEAVPGARAHASHVRHDHPHAEALGRTPAAAYGIGLVHGIGGSAGVTLLLIGTLPGRGEALAALALFALGTAASMATLSAGLGRLLGRLPAHPRLGALTPALGVGGLLFGAWYALGALDAVGYWL